MVAGHRAVTGQRGAGLDVTHARVPLAKGVAAAVVSAAALARRTGVGTSSSAFGSMLDA